MGNVGSFALIAAFILAIYTVVVSVAGYYTRRNDLVISAERGMYAVFAMVLLSCASLVTLLMQSNFNYAYVQEYSNRALPMFYKFAALWAGQAGSLMTWLLILATLAVATVYQNRNRNRELMPFVTAVLGVIVLFFITVCLFSTNPFTQLVTATPGGLVDYTYADGRGLNPLLQYWAMVIHPPILFIGYSGFAIPFAFAIAALLTGKLDAGWIKTTRRWTLFTFLFLTVGVVLGGKWAYVELGWGGYWAWDPVENASLMPWLTGTAYLHSVVIQEKRGMLKIWNMSLIIVTWSLCIFGTFLTRSGIVSSVHSFGESTLGTYFLIFLIAMLIFSFGALIRRLPELKSDNKLDSMLSRESSFLFNNLILLGAMFATLWGTMFPVLSEIFTGQQITVGAPFFNKVNIPIGLFLLFLTGVGPLFAYRRTTTYSLKKNFFYPFAASFIVGGALFALGIKDFYPLLSLFLCYFVFHTIVQEFAKGAASRHSHLNENWFTAIVNLTFKNTRRYGGYIVHMGIVIMYIGFTGSAYNVEGRGNMVPGNKLKIGEYELHMTNLYDINNDLYSSVIADFTIYKNGTEISKESPEKRFYHASETPSTEISIYVTPFEDLYIVLQGMEQGKAQMLVKINPFVSFVWLGTLIIVFGTLICMLPNIITKRNITVKEELKRIKALAEEN